MFFWPIIGQGRALAMLQGAFDRGRVASTYLFAGDEGIGKRRAAMWFAALLNCASPEVRKRSAGVAEPCGQCPACRKIEASAHPDIKVIEPDGGVIKVEAVRELEEMLSFKSMEARWRVCVIDEAHQMNQSAANAFLKTLEEPAPGTLIVLISSVPDRLLPTIRSRASRVNFRPLSAADCARATGRQADSPEVRLSMGRPGLAFRENLIEQRREFFDTLEKMLGADGKAAWKDRQDMEEWLDMLMLALRDMAAMKVKGRPVNIDMAQSLERMSSGASLAAILEAYEKVRELRSRSLFNLNKGITWNHTAGLLSGLGINA